MERDSSDDSSSDDSFEDIEDKRLELIHEIFTYANLYEELKRVKEGLMVCENTILQLKPNYIFDQNTKIEGLPPIKTISTMDQLYEEVEKVKEALEADQMKVALLESIISDIAKTHIARTNLESFISPMASPIHEPQHLSGDAMENSPHVPILPETLQLPEFIHDPNEAFLKEPAKESDISPQKAPINFQAPESPPVSPIQNLPDTPVPKTPPDFTDAEESYDGKGKQAANPKFRYKKRLTPEVSPMEVRSQKTHSEIASGSPGIKTLASPSPDTSIARISPMIKAQESLSSNTGIARISLGSSSPNPSIARISPMKKALGSLSPNTGIARISPMMKAQGSLSPNTGIARISLGSSSPNTGIARISPMMKAQGSPSPNTSITRNSPLKRKDVESDESSSTLISKSSVYPTDSKDDSTIVKKLKFDDDDDGERASKQCPVIAGLLSQKSYEPSSSSGSVGQSHDESEQLTLPLMFGFTKVVIYSTSDEGSSPLTSGNEDVPCSDTGGLILPSESDTLLTDIDDSSLMSVSDLSNDEPK